jgi:hypothetical protein
MTIFEYISVAASLVLALAIGNILSASSDILDRNRRDWLHVTWCVLAVLLGLGQWLALWRLNTPENWTSLQFFSVMLSVMIIYGMTHVLVTKRPEQVEDWSVHLVSMTRPLFTLLILSSLAFHLRSFLRFENYSVGFPVDTLVMLVAIYFKTRWSLIAVVLLWLAIFINAAYFMYNL